MRPTALTVKSGIVRISIWWNHLQPRPSPDCAACKSKLTSLLSDGHRKIVNVRLQTVMLYGMTFNSRPTVSNA